MKLIHSFFRKTHKLLFSAVAIFILMAIFSLTVFADDGGVVEAGLIINGTGAAGRQTGGKYTGPNSWSALVGKYQIYEFNGYRVYVVDKEGNLISDIIDLAYNNPSDVSNVPLSNIKVNKSGKKVTPKYRDIDPISSYTAIAEKSSSGVLKVYKAYQSEKVLGANFASWMETEDSSGDTNAKKLIYYAFPNKSTVKDNSGNYYATQADEYLDTEDYKLIIEPLIYSSIWTEKQWIQVDRNYDTKHIVNHWMYFDTYAKAAYDMCCTNDTYTRNANHGISYEEAGGIFNSMGWVYAGKWEDYRLIHNKPWSATATNDYDRENNERTDKQNALIKSLGYIDSSGNAISYNKLSYEQQIQVYNEMIKKGYELCCGTLYTTYAKDDGYVYTSDNDVTFVEDGKTTSWYGDYTVTHPASSWAQDESWTAVVEKDQNGDGIDDHHLVSAYTGKILHGTYNDTMIYLKTVTNLDGTKGSNGGIQSSDYAYLGDGFKIAKNDEDLKLYTSNTSQSWGLQIINMKDIGDSGDLGNPIHTKNPVDPTPSNPNDPTPPEEPSKTTLPSEPFDNTGSSTIIKVYGEIYKDGSTVYHIDHKATYSQSQTTDWIVIEDESKYKLQQWVVSNGTPDTDYTTTEWLNTDGTYSFDKSTLFTNNSAGYKLTYTAEDNFKIGEGRTIYLLYLKTLPAIETSDTKVPDTTTDFEPTNPTYPEVPTGDKKKDPNGYNIIKVYTILDEYNGTPLKSETYTQSSTTPFIKIEQESNWTLAHWKVTNTYNPSITAGDWCGTASTEEQLNQFYLNHFYDISSTSKFGTTYTGLTGNTPSTYYFNTSGTKDTLYILFVRTKGQAEYDAATQHITESYITKRFSTAGYWDYTNTFIPGDMEITVTTDSGI